MVLSGLKKGTDWRFIDFHNFCRQHAGGKEYRNSFCSRVLRADANEDPATGETLLTPTVHNKDAFLTMMDAPDDPGFDIRNVMVVFDDHGELALIRRYYVPWQ